MGTAPIAGATDIAISPGGRHAYVAARTNSAVIGLFGDGVGAPTVTGAACVSSGLLGSCTPAIGLGGVASLALSPDGAHLYAAAPAVSAVATFLRDPISGALIQAAAPCVADEVPGLSGPEPSEPGCLAAQGLAGAADIAISPEGDHLYVASPGADSVALLVRAPVTGTLTQPAGPSACVSTRLAPGNPSFLTEPACGSAASLAGANSVAVSPDGRHVYVTAVGSKTVTTFARDAATGALGVVACVSQDVGVAGAPAPAAPGCLAAKGLDDPSSIGLSPDGAHAYVTSAQSGTVASFRRDYSSGALEPLPSSCIGDPAALTPAVGCRTGAGIAGARDVVVSSDGAYVYIAADQADAVATFRRDPTTGTLTQLSSPYACLTASTVASACESAARLQGANALALTPGGRHLVVAAETSAALVSLERQLAPVCRSTSIVGVVGPTPVPLRCSDPNGDGLTFAVLSNPQRGTVTSIDQVSGAATYAPAHGGLGLDMFSFAAIDDGGVVADPAVASLELASVATAAQPTPALRLVAARDTRAPQLRSGKLVFESRRRVRIKLRCPTHEVLGCRGTITIKTARRIPVRILRNAKLAAGPRARARRVVLVDRLAFALKGAATRTVSTSLKKKHLRLLKRIGKTRVDVTLVGRDTRGNVAKSKRRVVLQPPRRR